jgi:hypothetical protein
VVALQPFASVYVNVIVYVPAAFNFGSNAPVVPFIVPPLFIVYANVVPVVTVPVDDTVTALLFVPLTHTLSLLTVIVGVGNASTIITCVTAAAILQPAVDSKLYVTECEPALKSLGLNVAVFSVTFVATVHVPVPVNAAGTTDAVIVCAVVSLIQCSLSATDNVAVGTAFTVIVLVAVPSHPLLSFTDTSNT